MFTKSQGRKCIYILSRMLSCSIILLVYNIYSTKTYAVYMCMIDWRLVDTSKRAEVMSYLLSLMPSPCTD